MNDRQSPVIFLRQNEKKRGDRDPDFTGSWMHPGSPERWASAWWNQTKDGKHYLRIIPGRVKEERDNSAHPAQTHPAGNDAPMSARYQPNRSAPGGPPSQPPGPPPGGDPWEPF